MDTNLKNEKKSNVFEASNLLSKFTFFFTFALFRMGFRKDIEDCDIYKIGETYRSKIQGNKLGKQWEKEKVTSRPNLLICIMKVYGWKFYFPLLAAYLSVTTLLIVAKPLLLGNILTFFSAEDFEHEHSDVTIYCFSLSLCIILYTIVHHFSALTQELTDLKVKGALCSLIYRKSLTLNSNSNICGQAITLMTKDITIVENICFSLYQTVVGPINLLAMTAIMYTKIGVSAIIGTILLLLLIPLQGYLGSKVLSYKLRTSEKTDERIQLTQEVLNSIQAIKMYSWEEFFLNYLSKVRTSEIRNLRILYHIKALALSIGQISSKIAIYVCIMMYMHLGYHITAEKAFVVIECLATIHLIVMYNIPKGIAHVAEFVTALRRITTFLLLEEISSTVSPKCNTQKYKNKPENGAYINPIADESSEENETTGIAPTTNSVILQDVSVKTNDNFDILTNINLTLQPGLNVLTGLVGSGKSSLLKVILGEVQLTSGTIKTHGVISYASQQAWLFPGTVKQNIIFNEEFDQKRYNDVIRVCGLKHDLDNFLNGDLTCVTDRGLNLSGGQKSRINLARAVYKQADIYLLDDSLSAIDTHISSHIFRECIKGFLKSKVCVFASQQHVYLHDADLIVIFDKGNIKFKGNFTDLQKLEDYKTLVKPATKENECIKEDEETTEKVGKTVGKLNTQILNKKNVYEEIKELGSVKGNVYFSYFLSGGGFKMLCLVVLLAIVAQAAVSWTEFFMSTWVKFEKQINGFEEANLTNSSEYIDTKSQYTSRLTEYSVFIIAACLLTAAKNFVLFIYCGNISTNLHKTILDKIVKAPMLFFNNNLAGNILNRFSRDLGVVDETMPYVLFEVSMTGLLLLSVLIVTSIVNQYFIIPAMMFASLLVLIRRFYIPTGRSLKRLQGTTRSAVVGHTKATFEGLTTIRASNAQGILSNEFNNLFDHYNSSFQMTLVATRAFAYYSDLLCSLYIAIITISFPFLKTGALAGNVGLALTQSLALTGYLQWGVRQWAELEIQMTSAERILEYKKIDTEDNSGEKPKTTWPSVGKIEYNKVSLRYYTGDVALKDLNFAIESKQKIGIVGRTGAGKSSLTSTLLRLYKFEGEIKIDGIDITTVPSNLLRSKISVILQDPILFSGTIRDNLDPYDEYNDDEIWNALEEVQVKKSIESLEMKVTEGGINFSSGERQLICLSRAILRNNVVIVLDEATANIDPETDKLIQVTLRKKFCNCTVITIAHRLLTVLDSDKIIVLDKGSVIEFDKPQNLLKNKNGTFYSMVKEAGLL